MYVYYYYYLSRLTTMSYQAQAQVAINGTMIYHLMVRLGTLSIIGTTEYNASILLALHVSMYIIGQRILQSII